VLAPFVNRYDLPELVLGGGLGVAYVDGRGGAVDRRVGASILDACKAAGITARIGAEPGRAVVAAAAVTLYTVGTVKELPASAPTWPSTAA
jgi:diaminopimelate decarboxylase